MRVVQDFPPNFGKVVAERLVGPLYGSLTNVNKAIDLILVV